MGKIKINKIISLLVTIIITATVILGNSQNFFKVSAASNEKTIYDFLIEKMGFNTAAACGVLANIEKESGFINDRLEIGYTWGSGGGYGICQWTNTPRKSSTGRRTDLVNWCTSHGYDYKSLIGQLYFLKHELEANVRPGVYSYLKGVPNTADGAYNAGYKWCYSFETPAGYNTGVSVTRGNYAKNTYWPRYSNNHVDSLEIDSYYAPYTPIIAYINTKNNVTTYSSNCSSSIGYIESGDKCTIQEIYTNGWCKVQYPISNGSKIGYTPLTNFFCNNSKSFKQMTADKNSDTYSRSDLSTKIGSIYKNDVCYVIGTSGGSSQLMYPTDNGNKIGWTASSVWTSPPTGYNIRVSSTSMYVGDQVQIYITPFDDNVTGYKFFAVKPNGETASKDLGSSGSKGVNFKPPSVGTYKIYAAVYNDYGEYKGSVTDGCVEVNVMEKEASSLSFSTKTVNLDLAGTNSATVNITAKGNLPSSYHFNCNRDTSVMSTKWGGWSGNTDSLIISGLKTGNYTAKISLIDDNTEQEIYKETIEVNITCSHKYTDKVVSPTTTEKGYTLHTCSKCGYSYKDNYNEFEFTASASSISLNGFESKNVTFSYKNYSGKVTISWNHGDDRATTLTWGEWSNNTIALNIVGYAKGTEKIIVSLKDTDTEKVIATKTITVTVTGIETKLNATSTSLSIDMSKNEKKSVTFSYENVPATTKHMNIRWVHGDDRATTLEWSGWENHTDTLYITGYRPGTESITVEFYDSETEEVLATKIIKVTVTCLHKYSSKVISPTCTDKGYTIHTCSICSDSYNDTYVNAKGHDYGIWYISKSATCTTDGVKIRECATCGKSETETIPKGHKYNDTVIAPTRLQKGYTSHICTNCDYTMNDNYTQYTEKVVIADIVLMQNYLVKRVDFDSGQFKQADMNSDGKVNVFDVIIMKRKLLNL